MCKSNHYPYILGEAGELVGKIGKEVIRRFDGYVAQKETQKKIACNVFSRGDKAFMTGLNILYYLTCLVK